MTTSNAKKQVNIRLSDEGRRLLDALTEALSAKSRPVTGRATTQTDVIEMALRQLARREKIL